MKRRRFLAFIAGLLTPFYGRWLPSKKRSKPTVDDGKWHHAVALFASRSKRTVYVDGEVIDVMVKEAPRGVI